MQLFEREGEKLRAATQETNKIAKEVIEKTQNSQRALMEKMNAPISHTAPVVDPPANQAEVDFLYLARKVNMTLRMKTTKPSKNGDVPLSIESKIFNRDTK